MNLGDIGERLFGSGDPGQTGPYPARAVSVGADAPAGPPDLPADVQLTVDERTADLVCETLSRGPNPVDLTVRVQTWFTVPAVELTARALRRRDPAATLADLAGQGYMGEYMTLALAKAPDVELVLTRAGQQRTERLVFAMRRRHAQLLVERMDEVRSRIRFPPLAATPEGGGEDLDAQLADLRERLDRQEALLRQILERLPDPTPWRRPL